ncbi:MAG: hypothetical protein R3A10_09690 [Caldilineaceae bacterium]
MLTWFEKILFIVALGASLYYGYLGFRKVYLVIMRSQGEKPTMAKRNIVSGPQPRPG